MPPQVPFIIGNEACERFSFYGMRNILTIFLIDWLLKNHVPAQAEREAAAKAAFHLFVFGVYFTPLLGGFLADRFLGKYRTILYISLLYCAGHACLAIFHDDRNGFYAGLVLIALGSGGIKPAYRRWSATSSPRKTSSSSTRSSRCSIGASTSGRSSPRC